MTTVIAEAGVNHDGRVEDAHALVDAAADAGADAVKFQTFTASALAAPDAPKADYQRRTTDPGESSADMLRRLELPRAAVLELADHARGRGIDFLSTPFDEDALAFLVDEVDVARVKLSSGDLTHGLLLRAAALTGRPLLLSTGMATMAEVVDALDLVACTVLRPDAVPTRAARAGLSAAPEGRAALQQRVTVLHCTSSYPAPPDQVNLRAMAAMAAALDVPVGYSDHTMGVTVAVAAAALGACTIEKHVTLSRRRRGPDHEASLEPDELADLVARVRATAAALGSAEKVPTAAEASTAASSRRGVTAARDLPAGTVVAEADLAVRRPRRGGDPMAVFDLLGVALAEDVPAGASLGLAGEAVA